MSPTSYLAAPPRELSYYYSQIRAAVKDKIAEIAWERSKKPYGAGIEKNISDFFLPRFLS